jgi:hypothetical protein
MLAAKASISILRAFREAGFQAFLVRPDRR